MEKRICISAPAKVNLHLEVYPTEGSTYHGIRSLFVMVSLFDELSVSSISGRQDGEGSCLVEGFQGLRPEDNLICRAHHLFCLRSGRMLPVRVRVDKRIPAMAGLGGGSSDAAAMLKAMNLMLRGEGFSPLSASALHRIAEELGSDVPFFLGTSAAFAEGRGEILSSLPAPPNHTVVLLKPETEVSTAEAYRLLDERGCFQELPVSREELQKALYVDSPNTWCFHNTFTNMLEEEYPLIGGALRELKELEADFSNVSGSGSAVYGVFNEEEKADRAWKTLKRGGKNAWKVKMLAKPPEPVYN